MKKLLIIAMAMSFLFLGHLVEAQVGANWTQVTNAAPWSARWGQMVVVLNGKMWLLGGYDGSNRNDVWSSPDGTNWTQVTAVAPWSPRRDHTAVAFNGKLWVLGGTLDNGSYLNDVWSSADGTNWTEVTSAAPWSGRIDFGTLAFNNQMWVIGGGGTNGGLNDVWSSTDGTNWTQATAAAPWSGRNGFGAVVFNNQMWVIGGAIGCCSGFFNDVWSSPDGTNWTQKTSAAPWNARRAFSAVALNGQMWIMGGQDANSYAGFLNDVWSSSDGVNWTQATSASPWSPRYEFSAVTFNGQIWGMGGTDWTTVYNDVWETLPPIQIPPRPNRFMLQSAQAGSTTYIDGLRVVDLDTGLVVYTNSFSNPSDATNNFNLYYWPQGCDATGSDGTNVLDGPMTAVVNGELLLETTGFNQNGNGGYNSHSEAVYTGALPQNFLVDFNAVRLQWAGAFTAMLFYQQPSDAPCPFVPGGALCTNRSPSLRSDAVVWTFPGNWSDGPCYETNICPCFSGANALTLPAPSVDLTSRHRVGLSLSNSIISFYWDGVLVDSGDISPWIAPSPPIPNFTANPTNGAPPLTVNFTDTSIGNITNRFWNFGDGTTTNATAPSVAHTYATGSYTVTLVVSGLGGVSTNIQSNCITVLTPFQAWQLQYFGCTNCPQAAPYADPDGDGYDNLQEFASGSDPTNAASYPANIPSNLVSWWKLDEGSGTTTADSSLNGANGTLLNNPTWVAGIINNGVMFNGNSQQIVTSYVPPLDLTNAITLSVWIKPTQPGASAPEFTQFFTKSDGYYDGWGLRFMDNQHIMFQMTGQNGNSIGSNSGLPLNRWSHVAATFDGTAARLYVNGVLDNTAFWSGTRLTNTNGVNLGGIQRNEANVFLYGALDDARVYSRALSQTEIQTLYQTDTDGDGIPNWWMQSYFGHPTGQAYDKSLAQGDADGTGQNNLLKYLAGLRAMRYKRC